MGCDFRGRSRRAPLDTRDARGWTCHLREGQGPRRTPWGRCWTCTPHTHDARGVVAAGAVEAGTPWGGLPRRTPLPAAAEAGPRILSISRLEHRPVTLHHGAHAKAASTPVRDTVNASRHRTAAGTLHDCAADAGPRGRSGGPSALAVGCEATIFEVVSLAVQRCGAATQRGRIRPPHDRAPSGSYAAQLAPRPRFRGASSGDHVAATFLHVSSTRPNALRLECSTGQDLLRPPRYLGA